MNLRWGPAATLAPTPVRVDELECVCRQLGLDDVHVNTVVHRFREGADLELTCSVGARFCVNNRSALLHREAVSTTLRDEVAAGVTRGPFPSPPPKNFHVNPLSARIKDNGKARLILDMSAPAGSSVNDCIDPAACSVKYASLDELAALIFDHGGPGTRLFKADIKAAFKLIPVRPDQHHALGFYWENQFWYQTALPFGCRISPRIFNDFAELLRDAVRAETNNYAILNYLDDFFGIEPSPSSGAAPTYQTFLALCDRVGVPLQPGKCTAPTTRVEILGIIIDTAAMTYELPAEKLKKLVDCLASLLGRRRATRRELLSLVGFLGHACKCLPPGRGFMRRLLDAAYSVENAWHRIRITQAVRADMTWWAVFAPRWNGTFPILPPSPGDGVGPTLSADSSRVGMGAVWEGEWWAAEWPPSVAAEAHPSMTLLEILPVLVAAVAWDSSWRGKNVIMYSDNMGVVGSWGRGWAREARTMAVIRQLLFRAACGGYRLVIKHLRGRENGPADALSRGDLSSFRRLMPDAASRPTPLPKGWVECVSDPVGAAHALTGVRL